MKKKPTLLTSCNIFFISLLAVFVFNNPLQPLDAHAYPIFAQQGYKNPREANGRIVCEAIG